MNSPGRTHRTLTVTTQETSPPILEGKDARVRGSTTPIDRKGGLNYASLDAVQGEAHMTYEVTVQATRTPQGWDLTPEGADGPVARVRTLDKARPAILEHLAAADPDADHSEATLVILPAAGELGADVRAARTATVEAAAAQEAAARATRDLVIRLDAAGYRSADIAGLLGVSRSRVSQLLHEGRAAT